MPNILLNIDPDLLDKLQREDIFQDDQDLKDGSMDAQEPEQTKEEKEDVASMIKENTELNEITRQVSKTRVPLSNEFSLPDDRKSYSFVDLVRKSNALADYQRNLFNTKF
jgi:predicted RNA-binding Zn ribbon-like protein